MQYVRSISGSVSKTWNSINPATLSGAIDVIVVQLEDGKQASKTEFFLFGWDQCLSERARLGRFAGLFSLPCSLREVLSPATL